MTSQANWVLNELASKRVIGAAPLTPLIKDSRIQVRCYQLELEPLFQLQLRVLVPLNQYIRLLKILYTLPLDQRLQYFQLDRQVFEYQTLSQTP